MRYVTVRKFASESGYTEDAIRSKIRDGVWRLGEICLKAPDGRTLIDMQGYETWVEAGAGSGAISDSSIEITFMYRGVRCRERVALKPTATNLKKALQHKAAIEHAITQGTFDYSVTFPKSPRATKFAPETSREIVGGFLTRWLAVKQKHVSSSTFEGYRKIVELRLVPALGHHLVVDLKRKAIRDWLDGLLVSNKTLNRSGRRCGTRR